MNWRDLPDQPHYGIFARRQTPDKKWEICLQRVIFGWRIRFGRAGERTYEFDWCAGDDPASINILYTHLCYLIRAEGAENVAVKYPPASSIKPYTMDREFIEKVFKNKVPNRYLDTDITARPIDTETLIEYSVMIYDQSQLKEIS